MTKKTFLPLLVGISALAAAQKTGINSTTPTEILDVTGTLRVRSLPNNKAANAIYTTGTNTNSGTAPTQTFTATKTVVVDNNGVMGTVAAVPPAGPQAEILVDDYDFIPANTPVTLATSGINTNGQIYTKAFTLARKALVVFSYSVSYSITNGNNGTIQDGAARSVQNYIYLGTGTRDTSKYYAYDSAEYTSYNGNSTIGNMGNSSTYTRVMAPGNYNVYLWGWVANAVSNTPSVKVNFGIDTDSFQVTAHYLE